MVQQNQFGGFATEDPNSHLAHFIQICNTIKMNGVSDDAIRLRLFPFSLRDKSQKFLFKFFPSSKTLQLKSEITQFRQFDSEPLYEAWERFRDLLRRCPQHGFPEDQQLCFFYNGLMGQTRAFVDAAAGGALLARFPQDALNLLEQMAMNSYQWPSERSNVRVAEISDSDPIKTLTAQVAALTTQVNYVNNRNFNNFRNNSNPTHYHPGLRNHEKFSYANTKNVLQPPPGFNASSGGENGEGKSSLEDALTSFINQSNAFMNDTRSRLAKQDSRMDKIEQVTSSIKNLETQMGQLATIVGGQHHKGQFPSNTEMNPKEQCKAIHLRSGTEYEGPKEKCRESKLSDEASRPERENS
ncbi:hypothetical protein DH2020_007978 [Rehmannia glutinosa]|uniref:Retrotransposon gag domain-containing protein n=1 Tax=Rehmannia glutinosa TaxID=99300 RepID=A0ABR0U023_REHGL